MFPPIPANADEFVAQGLNVRPTFFVSRNISSLKLSQPDLTRYSSHRAVTQPLWATCRLRRTNPILSSSTCQTLQLPSRTPSSRILRLSPSPTLTKKSKHSSTLRTPTRRRVSHLPAPLTLPIPNSPSLSNAPPSIAPVNELDSSAPPLANSNSTVTAGTMVSPTSSSMLPRLVKTTLLNLLRDPPSSLPLL